MASNVNETGRVPEKLSGNAFYRLVVMASCLLAWMVPFGVLAMPAIMKLGERGTLIGDSARVVGALIYAGVALWIYQALVKKLEQRSVDELSTPPGLRVGLIGMAFGLVFWCAVFGLMWLAGVSQLTGIGDGTRLFAALAACIVAAVGEELLFRGVMFRIVEQGIGTLAALLISALLFGLAHLANPHSTIVTALAIGIEAGLLFGLVYVVTRNLWFPIGVHFAWNFTQSGIFGIVGSETSPNGLIKLQLEGPQWLIGGVYGPEESVITITLGLAAAAWFAVLARRRDQWKAARFRLRLD